MVQTRSILVKANELAAALRSSSQDLIAERIQEIVEDRLVWDRMVLRLASELEQLLSNNRVGSNAHQIAERLLAEIKPQSLRVFDDAIYRPVRCLANEVAATGFADWQTKINLAISTGSTSTEIFMALRLYLDELLKSEWPLPNDVRQKATRIRNELEKAITEATGPQMNGRNGIGF